MKYSILFILSFLAQFAQAQFFGQAYPNTVSKNNLIVDYNFANPTSFTGSTTSVVSTTGLNLPATLVGAPTIYPDPGYIKFSASNAQYLMMGDFKNYYAPVSSSSRTGVFTISLWFNPTALNGIVLDDLNSTVIASSYHTADIEMVNGYLKFSVWPKNGIITSASAISLNSWHHVVLTYTGNSIAAYLDGSLINTSSYTRDGPAMSSLTTSQYFAIAGYDNVTNMGSGAAGSFLLSDVKYYSSSLSAEEVNLIYLVEKPNYDLKLMLDASNNFLSYPGSGYTWYDISGASKTATNAAGATYNAAASGSIYYNGGASGFTDFSFDLNVASTLTIEMWTYPTALSGGMFWGFNLYDVWTANGALGFNSAAGDLYGLTSTQVTNLGLLNTWKHYTFVINTGSYLSNKIYINGVIQSLSQIQGTQNTSNINFSNGTGRIGGWTFNNSYPQNMYMTFFKVYNRELTQTEITLKYNQTKSRHGL